MPPCRAKDIDRIQACVTIAFAQSSPALYDLEFQGSDIALARDMLCHDEIFNQIMLKSHHAGQSYGSDTILRTHIRTHGHSKHYLPSDFPWQRHLNNSSIVSTTELYVLSITPIR